jgi:serine/threonine protein kinase
MPAPDTLIDQVFDGRYKVVRKLGTGGMANVYLAEDQELGRRVAIKMLDDRHAQDEQFVERFRREAKNVAGLSHPNIVSIYDRGEAEGTYYIAMEYLEGRTLNELLIRRGPTPLPDADHNPRLNHDADSIGLLTLIDNRHFNPHTIVLSPV